MKLLGACWIFLVYPSIRLCVCKCHCFQSISVYFGISISTFICTFPVPFFGSVLMCSMVSSHNLYQYRLILSVVQWQSPEGNITIHSAAINSLASGGFGYGLKLVNFNNKHLKYFFLWNCYQVNATKPHWSLVNIGSGNGLVPSGNTPLPEPMLT